MTLSLSIYQLLYHPLPLERGYLRTMSTLGNYGGLGTRDKRRERAVSVSMSVNRSVSERAQRRHRVTNKD